MLAEWKTILNNWINCYSNVLSNDATTKCVNHDTLLSVLTQLNKNISLDESTSSMLEANTLEEFIVEKFPHFKFDNGTSKPTTETDIDIVASLLLYFVCVNSKDVNIKKIMCSQLDTEDQETIMKFSKFLMDCPTITILDIQNAVMEACGQDSASVIQRRTIKDTPPALRSLHNEVKRLQAALDAERFDRNYLQDELGRMQEKIDKLTQDKDQYKIEIQEMRDKLSFQSDEAENKAIGSTDSVKKTRKKLQRQVDDLEQRLYDARALIDEVCQERDVYKDKVNQLKVEREKWLIHGQDESARAGRLADELELERNKVEALNEVLAELRQHNKQNGLDGSLLECDDAHTSNLGANFNTSIVSEACANVVEVQLADERAKVNDLQQQIEILQSHLDDLTKKTEEEKLSFEKIINDKDENILNLKHRLNEQIEETNTIKSQYNDRIIELNNEVNELEQKLKSNNERYSKTIEEKIQEVQTLHQEKLSLLQSLSDKTTNLETIIQNLKTDLNTERSSKQNMMDDYENRIMKLNEKVTNRNNELVDLQNSMCEKSEMIECLHLQLRKEKDLRKELDNTILLLNKHKDNSESVIKSLSETKIELQQNIESETFKNAAVSQQLSELQKEVDNLNLTSEKLNIQIKEQNTTIVTLQNEIAVLESALNEQEDNYASIIEQKDSQINNLQEHLNAEISLKTELETEAASVNEMRNTLAEEVQNLKIDFDKLKEEIGEKDRMIDALDLYLNQEKATTSKLKTEIENLNERLQTLLEEVAQKTADYNKLTEELEQNKNENAKLLQDIEESKNVILTLESSLDEQTRKYKELEITFDTETSQFMTRINETERILKELRLKSNKTIEEKSLEIQKLQIELENVDSRMNTDRQIIEVIEREKSMLTKKLNEEKQFKSRLEIEYRNLQVANNEVTLKLQDEIQRKIKQINDMSTEIQSLQKEINDMKQVLNEETQLKEQKETMIDSLNKEIEQLRCNIAQLQQDNDEIQCQSKAVIESLRKENELLRFNIEETSISHQAVVKDKDKIIESVAAQAKESDLQQKSLHKLLEEVKFSAERDKEHLSGLINAKDVAINKLKDKIIELEGIVKEKCELIQKANDKKEEIKLEKQQIEKKLEAEKENVEKIRLKIENLQQECMAEKSVKDTYEIERNQLKIKNDTMIDEKQGLINENEILTQQLVEEKAAKDIIENEKATLIIEKEELTKRLTNILILKDTIETEKDKLNSEKSNLEKELLQDKEKKEEILKQNQSLETQLRILSNNLSELQEENKKLEYRIQELKAEQNILVKEKETLMVEKESAVKSLVEEKSVRDQIENEKNQNVQKIQKLIKQHSEDIKTKTQEFKTISDELKKLQSVHDEKHSTTRKISSTLSVGLERLLNSLKSEDIQNELLQKLISTHKTQNASPSEQCELLVNIADTLTTELSLRKKLEKALEHENSATNEMRQLFKQKEMQAHELQFENRTLQQNLADAKAELLKLTENYNVTLEDKHRSVLKLQQENQQLQNEMNDVKIQLELKVHSLKDKLTDNENLTDKLKKSYEGQIDNLNMMTSKLSTYLKDKTAEYDGMRREKERLLGIVEDKEAVIRSLEEELRSLKLQQEKLISDFDAERLVLKNMVSVTESVMEDQKVTYEKHIQEQTKANHDLVEETNTLQKTIEKEKKNNMLLLKEKENTFEAVFKQLTDERNAKDAALKEYEKQLIDLKKKIDCYVASVETLQNDNKEMKKLVEQYKIGTIKQDAIIDELEKLQTRNKQLVEIVEDSKKEKANLELLIKHELERNKQLVDDNNSESALANKYAEEINEKTQKVEELNTKIETLALKLQNVAELEAELKNKEEVISTLGQKLLEEQCTKEKYQFELEEKTAKLYELRQKIEDLNNEKASATKKYEEVLNIIRQRDLRPSTSQDKVPQRYSAQTQEAQDHHQVDISPSESQQSSDDSYKTISDLERIVSDKNRTITALQSDITYLKTLVAESENKLLDVKRELEISQDNCHQLSMQLKKLMQQKNDEITDLKRQVTKKSASENIASEIIKVSAKHQAMILKCIAEIKSYNALKELTNFGNQNGNADNEMRRSLAGNITIEDLEHFLENTDKHLKKCTEKQHMLQKERDRLIEVNKINETEIINMKNFLNQLSLCYKTFSLVKDVYAQRLSRIVTLQRSIRRDILTLDGCLDSASLCKLERGYTAVMQDLAECAMNIERWVERSLGRTISPEKIKQAFTSELDRNSLATGSYQNTSIEVQLEELESSFKQLQEEVSMAQRRGPLTSRETQSSTVSEVRAEYEDKLNRMKAKMKQLYQEQVSIFKEKQKEEFANMERQLKELSDRLAESSRANEDQKASYEKHIRKLTTELWSLGEKLLMKTNEAEWLKKKSRTPSLMSLQHVHSSGITQNPEDRPRQSDTMSLRSYQAKPKKSEGRALHMSDEEGEVFDNRWLHELETPPRPSTPPDARLSQLRWRNSLCPPHLKSSYPAETQFAGPIQEEHIKCMDSSNAVANSKSQRKEVGITAYKKPGPPTPSKQAGRLSATGSDLRDSIRGDPDPSGSKKTSTPSRLRSLFRSSKHDYSDGTPRKRLSIFKSKK